MLQILGTYHRRGYTQHSSTETARTYWSLWYLFSILISMQCQSHHKIKVAALSGLFCTKMVFRLFMYNLNRNGNGTWTRRNGQLNIIRKISHCTRTGGRNERLTKSVFLVTMKVHCTVGQYVIFHSNCQRENFWHKIIPTLCLGPVQSSVWMSQEGGGVH